MNGLARRGWAALLVAVTTLAYAPPATADVRAEYAVNGSASIVAEVDDDGSARIEAGPFGYLLLHGGREYWVRPGPGGPIALTAEAVDELDARERRAGRLIELTLEADESGDPALDAAIEEAARAAGAAAGAIAAKLADETAREARASASKQTTFAGWLGEAVEVPGAPDLRLVVSADAALAPLGDAMFRYWRNDGGENGAPSLASLGETLRGKAPLAFGLFELRAVSFDPLPASRFALPDEIVTLADLPPEEPDALPDDSGAPSVLGAVFWDGAVWMRDGEGGLHRTPEGEQEQIAVDVPGRAVGLCRAPTALWLVTANENASSLRLWARTPRGWSERDRITVAEPGPLLGIECSGEHPLLLVGEKLVTAGNGRTLVLDRDALPAFGFATLLRLEDALYIGVNAGEWGGGLRRVDLATGAIEVLQAPDGELCGGLLNAECDPVTGLASDPVRPGCVLVTTGLVHFIARGEILRVCGASIERVYRKPYTIETIWSSDDDGGIAGTVPFFAAAVSENAVWAVGADGLYRFGREGTPELRRFPMYRASGIDWSHPDVVLIPTDMNGRHSVSGSSLLIAARR